MTTYPKNEYQPTENSFMTMKYAYLVEELGELLAALGKAQRWGLDSVNPELPPEQQETNRDWIKREIQDVKYAINLMEKAL